MLQMEREAKLLISGITHSDPAASVCLHSFSSCLHSPPQKRAPHKPYHDALDVIGLFKIHTSLNSSYLFEVANHNWPNEEITAFKDQEDSQKWAFLLRENWNALVWHEGSWIAPSILSFCLYWFFFQWIFGGICSMLSHFGVYWKTTIAHVSQSKKMTKPWEADHAVFFYPKIHVPKAPWPIFQQSSFAAKCSI